MHQIGEFIMKGNQVSWTQVLEKLSNKLKDETLKDRMSGIKVVLLLDLVKKHKLHLILG